MEIDIRTRQIGKLHKKFDVILQFVEGWSLKVEWALGQVEKKLKFDKILEWNLNPKIV